MNEGFLRRFANDWLTAWNSRSTDRVVALLHPSVTWDEQIFWPGVLHGPDAVRDYVDGIWKAMPAYRVEEIQLFTAPQDGRALVFFRQSGEAPEGIADGVGFEASGCDIFLEFRDGLLSHYTAAYEITDMLRQMGALPPRGGMKGGAYLLSLNARQHDVDDPLMT